MSVSFWNWVYSGGAGLCWATLLLTWSIGALASIRQRPTERKPSKQVLAKVIALVCVVLLILLCTVLLPTLRSIWQLLSFDIPYLRPFGLLLLIVATVFTLWARIALGMMWSSMPLIRPDHILRTSGPYRITRHPIYTGLLGMIIGSLLMLASHQWFVTVIEVLLIAEVLVILHLKSSFEERLLVTTFGEDYIQFQKHVPQLLPFIKKKATP